MRKVLPSRPYSGMVRVRPKVFVAERSDFDTSLDRENVREGVGMRETVCSAVVVRDGEVDGDSVSVTDPLGEPV